MFLATVAAVLAGAEVVMLLRGGDVEARTGEPAASASGAAVRSADDATWSAAPRADPKPGGREGEREASRAAYQNDQ
ncbi:MAG TPA: hypothetical protein VGM06_26605 [Polyangiaceae bacterium]